MMWYLLYMQDGRCYRSQNALWGEGLSREGAINAAHHWNRPGTSIRRYFIVQEEELPLFEIELPAD